MKKKAISLLLAAMMLLGTLPVSAMAVETPTAAAEQTEAVATAEPKGEAAEAKASEQDTVSTEDTGDTTENPKGTLVFTTDFDDSELHVWYTDDDTRLLEVGVNKWYNKDGVLEDLPDYAKVKFTWYNGTGITQGTGMSSTDRTATWKNPYIRFWESNAGKEVKISVKATCTIDGVEYTGKSKTFRYVVGMDPIHVFLTVNNKGELAATKDNAPAMNLEVKSVKDTNMDFKVTLDEVLAAAHEQYKSKDDFAITEQGWVTKLWGVNTSNTLFYVNGTAGSETVDKTQIKAKDSIYASVNADDKYFSDVYTKFDEVSLDREPNEEFTLTLTDADGKAISGAEVGQWKDGKFTAFAGKTTNDKGEVTLALAAGDYLISAKGTSKGTVTDWSTSTQVEFDRPIMAPYCTVKVAVPEGDVSGSGTGNSVHWLMDSKTGTLRFTGTGKTTWSNWQGDPWAARYKDKIKKIVFGEGITEVNLEFKGYTALEEVQLPASLTKLTSSEFENCTALKTITFAEGCAVKLSSSVFAGCTGLESVTLPATVDCSGSGQFKGCTGLKEVTIACATGKQMFQDCTSLEKVTYQEGVTSFGESTFAGCTALKTVYVPASLNDFGVTPFDDVSKITFEGPGKDNFNLNDGYIYNSDKTGLFGVPDDLETFEVPATVTTIGDRTFANHDKLTKVTFAKGSKLETLGQYAFQNCTALTDITLPDTITEIPAYAFDGCTALKKFTLPSAVKTIGSGAFQSCGLTAISLPKGLETIEYAAFRKCENLTKLVLPESLTTFGRDAAGGTAVEELIIPANVTKIQEFADSSAPWPALKRVDIKANVAEIPYSVFAYCTGLESLKIPASVKSVGSGALNANITCVVYYGGSYETVKTWSVWKYTISTKPNISVICNYVEPTTKKGGLEVESYPENIMEKTADLATKTISLKLNDPNAQEGDKIWADWYYSTKTPDGFKYLKPLTDYTFDSETMTTTVTLSEQAAKKTTNNWYYVCLAFKTDAAGNTTLLTTKPITALQLGAGMEFQGKGSAEEPFLINSYEDYQNLAKTVNNGAGFGGLCFKLTSDLTLPKGCLQTGKSNAFYGVFDGDGHTVTIEDGGTSMFGILEEGALVKNVKVKGENIDGSALASSVRAGTVQSCEVLPGTNTTAAALAGGGSNGAKFINCTVHEGVNCGWDSANSKSTEKSGMGSIIGSAVGVTITNCKSAATVYGKDNVGGMVGKQSTWNGIVTCSSSQFTGKIVASGEYVGGIMGRGYDAYTAPNALCSSIENCYVNADITGAQAVGGIFGGEGGVDQAWSNGPGRIRNNVFIGSLNLNGNTVGEYNRNSGLSVPADNIGNTKGGIFGFMRSLNMYNIIENNYYYVTNDPAAKGFGAVEHIDTSARSFGFDEADDVFYYCTSRDSAEDIKAWVDREDIGTSDEGYTSVTNRDVNRTDDPLGKDADKLVKAMTETELKDGSIVQKLNDNKYSMKNWVQGENGPQLSNKPVITEFTISGDYKTEYYIGEKLDMTGAVFTVSWSDGSVTHPTADEVEITGFSSSTRKVLTLTAAYGNATVTFDVKVLKKSSGGSGSNTITVSFTLLGDTLHEEETVHTLKNNNLTTWISKTEYTVDANATVADLLEAVEASNDALSFDNPTGKWVNAVTFEDVTLEQLDNNSNSGWMYTLNGHHPLLRVDEQFLENGDKIVFHWTDDYTIEEGSEPWNNGGSGGSSTTSDEKAAAAVDQIINAIGTVTVDSKAKIESARAAYDKLTDAQKKLVKNYDKLTKAESDYAKLALGVPFVDVKGHWALDAIKYAYDGKLMNGVGDDKFAPDETLTRGMLVTVLYRMTGEPKTTGGENYTDVAANSWYADAVQWASAGSIVNGVGENRFEPETEITREQFATMLYRYAQYMKYQADSTAGLDKFTDAASVSDWAETAMKWAVGAGLISGRTATTIVPGGTATRAEAATLLMRFAQNVAK